MGFGLWERDALIPFQHAWAHESARRSPEKRLLAAVLMDAVLEFREIVRSPHEDGDPRLHRLRAWFFAHDQKWPFSFENVCEQLDLDPNCIRNRLATLANDGRPRPRGKRSRRA